MVEALPGELLAICDDDVVFPSSWASVLAGAAARETDWGFLAPVCVNSRVPADVFLWGGYRYSSARDAVAAAKRAAKR